MGDAVSMGPRWGMGVLFVLLLVPAAHADTTPGAEDNGLAGEAGEPAVHDLAPEARGRGTDSAPGDSRPAAPLAGLPVAALLTRLPAGKALENKNRRKLYQYIREAPGTTFREVLRATGMAAGTARHHLTAMARWDMIVERCHRSTLRYFENHGKFDHDWHAVVFLREPEFAKVHDWIRDNPDEIQKTLLEHAESTWGWHRSTTQHRLTRLVEAGLVKYRQAGRRKFYSVTSP